jgi:hypothetical protein
MDKFIFKKQKALSPNLCDDLIDFYEKCPNKRRNPKESRNYTMLQLLLTNFPEVFNPLSDSVRTYTKQHTFLQNLFHPWGWSNEFLLQKYEIGECYSGEHMEHGKYDYDCRRVLAWMIYLNDCSGGTYWPQQRFKTRPRKGDLYIWPAGWTHSHYGLPSKQEKYILTGWCEMYK